jgi:hypothetical protein
MKIFFPRRHQLDNRDAQNLGEQVRENRNLVGYMYLAMTICFPGRYFLVSNG